MVEDKVKNIITGGAGFIGSHLVDRLLDEGQKVLVLDNLFTGRKANIEKWIGHPNFQFKLHDVTLPIDTEADMIWHLACPASPVHYQLDPIKTAKTNFLGTLNMLNLAKKNNARFIFASTSEIYGDPEVHPQTEIYNGSVNIIGPRSCYDEGKRISETLCYDFKRMHNLEIRVMRIFNTYGPRMLPNDGRVVSNFITQAIRGESLTIYGDGSQTRSFCFVSDLVEGIINLMHSNYDLPINLGNNVEFTILELAELIKNELNPNLKFIFKKLPKDDPKRRKPDLELARKTINWEPKIKITEGITKTIDYFKQELKIKINSNYDYKFP
tara:strand:- start:2119 stop:3096 length:978 start_codon:yes stop_codon:yes gene_type:complete